MKIIAAAVLGFGFLMTPGLRAEEARLGDAKITALRMEILALENTKRKLGEGWKHCDALDGKSIYLENQKRVQNIEDYHGALLRLVKDQAFNPEKKRPWSAEDAEARWQAVQKLALEEKSHCATIAKLPALAATVLIDPFTNEASGCFPAIAAALW
jgi:hypothetical protein